METVLGAVKGALLLSVQLFAIIVPLTILYEFLKSRQAGLAQRKRSLMGISGKGFIPLATGIIIGLTYGAGVIIHSIRSSDMTRREAFLILLYLSICHAIIEDTLIFVIIGANAFILVGARFLLATLITYCAYKLGWFEEK